MLDHICALNQDFVFYSLMTSSMLHSISDYLESGMDACIVQLYDSTTLDIGEDDSQNNHSMLFKSSMSVELRSVKKILDCF